MSKFSAHRFVCHSLLLMLALSLCGSLQARQFRQIIPIATPKKAVSSLPEGAVAVDKHRELGREAVKAAVEEVLSKWNGTEMEDSLDENFFDKSRLTDAMDTVVPRDATLRVQSVQGVQTLQQYVMPGDEGDALVSIVSATVRTQVEFNTPSSGFVSLPGVNEFLLQITQPASAP